eukprot:3426103-Rhodomonas_salina.1
MDRVDSCLCDAFFAICTGMHLHQPVSNIDTQHEKRYSFRGTVQICSRKQGVGIPTTALKTLALKTKGISGVAVTGEAEGVCPACPASRQPASSQRVRRAPAGLGLSNPLSIDISSSARAGIPTGIFQHDFFSESMHSKGKNPRLL